MCDDFMDINEWMICKWHSFKSKKGSSKGNFFIGSLKFLRMTAVAWKLFEWENISEENVKFKFPSFFLKDIPLEDMVCKHDTGKVSE